MTMYLDDEGSAFGTWPTSTSARRPAAGRSTSPTTSSGTTAATTRATSPRRSGAGRRTARPAPRCPSVSPTRSSATPARRVARVRRRRRPPGRPAHRRPTHWWGGYTSQSDTDARAWTTRRSTGGETVTFWNWHFIEEGWDYGFVEALVGGEWQTRRGDRDATGAVVSHRRRPARRQHRGQRHHRHLRRRVLRRRAGVPASTRSMLPAGATDVQCRYSTDAAYLDTGWFIDDVSVGGAPAAGARREDGWVETTGEQDNNWTVQVISNCDLTPGAPTEGETVDPAGNFVYRFTVTRSAPTRSTPGAPTATRPTSSSRCRTCRPGTSRSSTRPTTTRS